MISERELIKMIKRKNELSKDELEQLEIREREISIERLEKRIESYKALKQTGHFSDEYLLRTVLNASDLKFVYENIEFIKKEIQEIKSRKRREIIDSIIDEDN
jgi:hypothetical protein